MKKLTSRERVRRAVRGHDVDMIPLMLQIEPHTILTLATKVRPPKNPVKAAAWKALADFSANFPNKDIGQYMTLLSLNYAKDYFSELGGDFSDYLWTPIPLWFRGAGFKEDKLFIKDMYGEKHFIGGQYLEMGELPCPDKDTLAAYQFPDVSHPVNFSHVRIARRANPDAFMLGCAPGVQDWGQRFHPMQSIYTGMIEYPEIIKGFFEKLCEHSLVIIRGMLEAGCDAICVQDDYGTQQSMLISKKMWTEFTYPMIKRQIEEIHACGGIAMLHSCGVVAPLLDKLADAGLDVLHPFQPLPGNDLAAAKKEYGNRLCFATGMCVQRIGQLSPEDAYKDIVGTAKVAAEGGRFILAHTNGLQNDTPIENLKAMFEAIDDVRAFRF